jgi:hypothetical protein
LVGLSVAIPAPSTLEADLQNLQFIADERARLFRELFPENEREAENPVSFEANAEVASCGSRRGPAQGLHIGSLTRPALGAASGLQSNARGLTPESEWRRMFPHKPGHSR